MYSKFEIIIYKINKTLSFSLNIGGCMFTSVVTRVWCGSHNISAIIIQYLILNTKKYKYNLVDLSLSTTALTWSWICLSLSFPLPSLCLGFYTSPKPLYPGPTCRQDLSGANGTQMSGTAVWALHFLVVFTSTPAWVTFWVSGIPVF